MPQNGVNELLALLRKSRLLKEEQLAELQQLVQQPESAELTPEQLAQQLVQQQVLTDWQSGQILRGQTGFVLQQYRLLNPVGRGGMGHVFRAVDDRNGDVVAIKVMAKKLSVNQTLVNRFRREIRASSQLNCPHIVRTLDAGRVGKTDFMVMEYVNGEQLDRLATRLMLIPERICCEIIRQAAIGLQHAFEKQMVHRDIKPANLIIHWSDDGRGTVKVMDMGLVRLTAETEEQKTVTKAGQVMGTPDYMSPEQGWDTTKVDIRSDIYSLGLTFFRLLTGRIPFPGDNPLQVLMARCSRDAPSPRGFRPEISPEVDAIVRRMTFRDPTTRYQTPNELIAELEPLCSPLTRDAVQAGETNDWESQELRIVTGESSQADIQDAGYQQFLREMDSGAAVDLMTVSGGGGDASISGTLPVIDRSTASAIRKTKPRGKLPVGVVAGVTAAIAVTGIVIALSGGDSGTDADQKGGSGTRGTQEVAKPLPVAVIAKSEPASVIAGESVSVQTQLTVRTAPVSGQLVFALGKSAPASASISKETGQVTWDVPQTQTPLDYHLPVEVYHEDGNTRRLVTSEVLTIRVLPIATTYTFPEISNQRITAGQKFDAMLAVNPPPPDPAAVRYEITSGALPGMEFSPDSGRFTWTPDVNDVGRHEVVLKLVSVSDQKVLATRTLRLAVRPGMIKIQVPNYPEQTAKAGELFRMSLGDRPLTTLPRAVRIRVAPESPNGVVLDLQKPELTWPVPADVSGRVEIRIIAEPAFPDVEFSRDSKLDTRITINVQPGAAVKTVPAEAEVDAEEARFRELLSREFAQLRTVAQRQELAYQLLERAIGLPDGPQHFALLNLAEEQSERARSTELLLEIHRLRAQRYGVDELTSGLEALESFRRSSVSGVQADIVIEQTVRLAKLAVEQDRWKDVAAVLEPAGQLLRNSSGLEKVLATDLDQVRKVSEQVSSGSLAVDDLTVQEAERLLAKWQFAPLFDQPSTLAFLQAGTNPGNTAGDGRDRWTITSDRFHLTGKEQGVLTGFLESARESDRYVIRFHAAQGTNALQFVFGASPSQQLDGFILTLDPTGYGKIQKLPGGAVVADAPNVSVPAAPYGSLVEIAVDGQQVSARVNGIQVANQRIPELRAGRVGILAPLSRPAPGPTCDLRRPRILILTGN